MSTRVLVTGPAHVPGRGGGITKHAEMMVEALAEDPMWTLTLVPTSVPREHRGPLTRLMDVARVLGSFRRALPACDMVHFNTTIQTPSLVRDCVLLWMTLGRQKAVVVQFHGGHPSGLGFLGRAALRQWNRAGERLFLTRWQLAEAHAVGVRGGTRIDNAVDAPRNVNVESHSGGLKIVCLSRLARGKGVEEALAAFSALPASDAALVVAGDGEELSALKARAAEDPRVTFTGWVDEEAKGRVLAEADVMVAPSHSEAMPYALLEGLAAGLACVVSDAIELSADIAGFGAGITVAAGSVEGQRRALERLTEDPEARRAMQLSAKELWSSRFTPDVLARSLDTAWKRALA